MLFRSLAEHYNFAVMPARPYKPKDKAKAEAGVLLVTRWILAVLRKRKFFSIRELNEAIKENLGLLNAKNFQKLPGNRESHFKELDEPNAQQLPTTRYLYAHVKYARVNIDYHIILDDHFYSVPYRLRGKKVKLRISENVVEIFFSNNRVALHQKIGRAHV